MWDEGLSGKATTPRSFNACRHEGHTSSLQVYCIHFKKRKVLLVQVLSHQIIVPFIQISLKTQTANRHSTAGEESHGRRSS